MNYLADDRISQVVFLAEQLGKPVLVEGPAGVGKTELAKALATVHGRRLIRLQCYEGLDESKAIYEWNYKKQLLRIQADSDSSWQELEDDIFAEDFGDQIARIVRSIRNVPLKKAPSVSESIDWAKTLLSLGVASIESSVVTDTLHVLLKYQGDIDKVTAELKIPAEGGGSV